jgi:hypothetical protein
MPLTRDDYATLEVQSAIFHDLPRQATTTPGVVPILSEAVTPLNEASRQHLRSKLVDTLQSTSSYAVQFLDGESVVSASVRAYLNHAEYDEADFIARSRAFAQDLFARQGPQMSAGLLCVVACTVNGRSAIALMKIEREEGAQLELSGVAGHRTFTFELLNNLVFTKNTKLYKAGLFAKVGPEEGSIGAAASDQQFGNVMAQYWLDFLGCQKQKEPRVETQRFFDTIIHEVNRSKNLTPVEKNEVYEALLVEMRSRRRAVNVNQFVREHVPEAAQEVIRSKLRETGVDTHFDKDTSDIKSSITRKVFRTRNNIRVTAPEAVEDLVAVTAQTLTVRDPVVQIGNE